MDNLTKEHRHKNMQNIRSKDSKIEILMRSELHKKGLRFRKHYKNLIGKPDIVFVKARVVVFLDSCFFHMCPYHYVQPKSNKSYWLPKLKRNKERAKEVNKTLRKDGWKVIRFWEHQIKKDVEKCINKIVMIAKN
jgi:DNA mismatch endonuclease (patch repair protein)